MPYATTTLVKSAFLALFFISASQAVLHQNAAAAQPAPQFASEPLVVTGKAGVTHPFTVELALTGPQREYGLMFRTDMAADHGMLFVFDRPQRVQMWMENTVLPLDMLFLDTSGKVMHIAENAVPYSQAIIDSDGSAKYVIEINAGIVKKLGLAVGDTASSPTIGKH